MEKGDRSPTQASRHYPSPPEGIEAWDILGTPREFCDWPITLLEGVPTAWAPREGLDPLESTLELPREVRTLLVMRNEPKNAEHQKQLEELSNAIPSDRPSDKIPRPAGTSGNDFNIQNEMGLGGSQANREIYKALMRNLRDLALQAGIQWESTWAEIPTGVKARLFDIQKLESDTHIDFSSVTQAIVHCDGEKLCLFWPATPRNLNWWGLPRIRHSSRLEEALDALEGLEVMPLNLAHLLSPLSAFTLSSLSRARHTHVSPLRMLRIGPWQGKVWSSAKHSFVTPCNP
ncbi:hypothetical protein B0H13DRAFT_2354787 [Mycena leptocephala]|nr:hypothetical protein B0H13DRAFT_2354787 [Mycena leptocephala]